MLYRQIKIKQSRTSWSDWVDAGQLDTTDLTLGTSSRGGYLDAKNVKLK